MNCEFVCNVLNNFFHGVFGISVENICIHRGSTQVIKELFSGADKTNQRLLSSIHAYNRDSDRIVSKVIRYVSWPNFEIENIKWSKLCLRHQNKYF